MTVVASAMTVRISLGTPLGVSKMTEGLTNISVSHGTWDGRYRRNVMVLYGA